MDENKMSVTVKAKLWSKADRDRNQPETSIKKNTRDVSLRDVITKHADGDNKSERKSSVKSSKKNEEVDLTYKPVLDKEWSLLDDIMSHVQNSNQYKEISEFFFQKKSVENIPSEENEVDKENVEESDSESSANMEVKDEFYEEKECCEEKDVDTPKRNWSLLEDIVSHFSGSELYGDISHILTKNSSIEADLEDTDAEDGPLSVLIKRNKLKKQEKTDIKLCEKKDLIDTGGDSTVQNMEASDSEITNRESANCEPNSDVAGKKKNEEKVRPFENFMMQKNRRHCNPADEVRQLEEQFAQIDFEELTSTENGKKLLYEQVDLYIARLMQDKSESKTEEITKTSNYLF